MKFPIAFIAATSLVFASLTYADSHGIRGADWIAPIYCSITIQQGERAPKIETISGASSGQHDLSLQSRSSDGMRGSDRYRIEVFLKATNSYMIHVLDLNTLTKVSREVIVAQDSTEIDRFELRKEYPVAADGIRFIRPQYSARIECHLRSQDATPIPAQPGGHP